MSNRICNVLIIDEKDLPVSFKLEDEMLEMHIVMYKYKKWFKCIKNKNGKQDKLFNSISDIERIYNCEAIVKYWKR